MAFGGRKIDSSIDAPRHDIVLASRRAINLRVAWIGGSATSTQAASVHFIWSHLHRTRPRSVAYKLPRVRDNRNAKRKKTINCNDTNASVVCPPYRSLSLSSLTLHAYFARLRSNCHSPHGAGINRMHDWPFVCRWINTWLPIDV